MQLTVTGKHIDTNAVLRQHVAESLDAILDKYFKTAIEAHVVFSKEAHLRRAEVSIHIGRGIGANASAVALETYAAFDAAAERIAKQMRRYKRRLQNHHMHAREAFGWARQGLHTGAVRLRGGSGGGPLVAAEMSPDFPTPQVPRREG
jgi:ribosome hibernation promoting factor